MNIQGNEQTSSKPRELYWGLCNFNVTAVNPTLNQAKELNIPVREDDGEIDYTVKDEAGKVVGCRFTFFLQAEEGEDVIYNRASYRVKFAKMFSERTGKYQFCNNHGNTAWAATKEDLNEDFLAAGGVRECLMGESNLLDFMKAFFDIRKGQNCTISMEEYKNNFFKNNFKPLQDLIAGYPTNQVKFINGVREYTTNEGEIKYAQGIVDNIPLRPYAKVNDYFLNQLDYYLNNTDPKYLVQIPEAPYTLEVWTPEKLTNAVDNIPSEDSSDEPW